MEHHGNRDKKEAPRAGNPEKAQKKARCHDLNLGTGSDPAKRRVDRKRRTSTDRAQGCAGTCYLIRPKNERRGKKAPLLKGAGQQGVRKGEGGLKSSGPTGLLSQTDLRSALKGKKSPASSTEDAVGQAPDKNSLNTLY